MHIRKVKAVEFRRFSHLEIDDLSAEAELVILAGPNGNGKSSLFDAFLNFADQKAGWGGWDDTYHRRLGDEGRGGRHPEVEFHEPPPTSESSWRRTFYFRSAYRNDPDFQVSSISRMGASIDEKRFSRLIDNDAAVNQNYLRLVGQGLEDVYEVENASTTIGDFREKTIGLIRDAVAKVLPHLVLDSLGNPMTVGTFRFSKGATKGYNYKNLSGGEKAVFDLILDLSVKRREFNNTVFCIDEPEAHLNPKVHAAMLDALISLTRGAGQLWIATHSIGMMRRAVELHNLRPGSVAFLDFDQNFDVFARLTPVTPSRVFWQKTLSVALADMAELIAPREIIACEGSTGDKIGDVADASIYNVIFGDEKPEVRFVSIGSSTDVEGDRFLVLQATAEVVSGCRITRLIDRDEMTDQERAEKLDDGTRVLTERHIESYLFDDEVLQLLAKSVGQEQKMNELLAAKKAALDDQVARGKAANHIKSSSGRLRVEFSRILNLSNSGKTTGAFMRDCLAPLIKPGTNVYERLCADIFGEC